MEVTIDQALLRAVEHHRSGQLREAEVLYRAIIQAQPNHPDANHNLGVLAASIGRPFDAIPFFRSALSSSPDQPQFWVSLIECLERIGNDGLALATLAEARSKGIRHDILDQLESQLTRTEGLKSKNQKSLPLYSERRALELSKKKSKKLQSAAMHTLKLAEPSQSEIKIAFELYIAEKWTEAEVASIQLTQKFPNHPFGWKLLGAVLTSQGRKELAVEAKSRAVHLDPNDAEAHSNLGNTLKELGRLDEAEAHCRAAIRINPLYAEAHSNLGNILKDIGRPKEAEASCREAIRIKPNLAVAHSNLSNVLTDLDRLEEAEASCREAIHIKADYAEAHSSLGVILKFLGRLEESETHLREAIRIKSDHAEAHSNLGVTLYALDRPQESEASYREAIRIRPDYAEAHSNLGNVLKDFGHLEEAEARCREAIRIKPNLSAAYNNLGNVLKDIGRLQAAEDCYQKAIRIKRDFTEAHSNRLLLTSFLEGISPSDYLHESKKFSQLVAEKRKAKFSTWLLDQNASKLRVGLVSGDLRNHPVGYFIESLCKNLNRNRIELISFSNTYCEDELSSRIKPFFHEWCSIVGLNDEQASRAIHNARINVLIDLSGHTAHNRLGVFSWKPAPIQVTWLGYWASTGVTEVDYVLGDPYVTPPTESAHFRESIWPLPETYLCFTPPKLEVSVAPLPALANGHITFGCFNNLSKMGRDVVELWSKVLHEVNNSRLFLKTKQLADPAVVKTVIDQFSAQGIDATRLLLEGPSSRAELLSAYNRVDIALDPFPYPGGTTTAEALWMGVPVLTKMGDRFLSHIGESIAHNTGQSDWIAQNDESYVEKAVTFASNLRALSETRQNLRTKVISSPLFDAPRFARHFEEAMWGMWSKYENGDES